MKIRGTTILLSALVAVIMVATYQRTSAIAVPATSAVKVATAASADDAFSLITETPEEGFALAITLSRRGVTATQPETDVLHALRPGYAHDAEALIAASHVVAVHFQTVAAANGYWHESP